MNKQVNPAIFKAYDIRGIYPTDIDENAMYKIAQAYTAFVKPKTVALGKDVRTSGPSLWESAKNGLIDAGVNVVDIGVISTDMLYFAVAHYGYDGGLTITASHNPREYNGVKMVREQAIPISSDTGLFDMRDWVLEGHTIQSPVKGTVSEKNVLDDYAEKVLSFLKVPLKKRYKAVVNANFGMSGVALQKIIDKGNLPLDIIELNFTPDGTFPKGPPNPILPDNQKEVIELIKEVKPDFGVAWDADADRIFFFDENGTPIDGYFMTAIQSRYFLQTDKGGTVIGDPRLYWAVQDTAKEEGGKAVICKVGHTFIKEKMRNENAVFGGEMSGHYYFRDFFFCDNGMIALMVVLQILDQQEKFSDMSNPYSAKYFISGEINFTVKDAKALLEKVKEKYKDGSTYSAIDGDSFSYDTWRFNLRSSNTEPLVRLNIEGRDKHIVEEKTKEITDFVNQHSN